uniref:Matrin-type domain-containing protein n=1 Tax=Timema tahoe TaxID=61484 RepID=A0A7R9FFI0_9NEOP|nr:unnamed protein product [Timema tahoe]
MDFQNRPGGKTGGGGQASWSESNRDRRERLRQLALETIDLNKDPYFMKNHLGSYECKLCLTLHNNEGSYLAHTQGKKHQANLARRAAKEAKESPQQPAPEKPRVEPKKFVKIGRPGYRRYLVLQVPSREVEKTEGKFWTHWNKDTKQFFLQFAFKHDSKQQMHQQPPSSLSKPPPPPTPPMRPPGPPPNLPPPPMPPPPMMHPMPPPRPLMPPGMPPGMPPPPPMFNPVPPPPPKMGNMPMPPPPPKLGGLWSPRQAFDSSVFLLLDSDSFRNG